MAKRKKKNPKGKKKTPKGKKKAPQGKNPNRVAGGKKAYQGSPLQKYNLKRKKGGAKKAASKYSKKPGAKKAASKYSKKLSGPAAAMKKKLMAEKGMSAKAATKVARKWANKNKHLVKAAAEAETKAAHQKKAAEKRLVHAKHEKDARAVAAAKAQKVHFEHLRQKAAQAKKAGQHAAVAPKVVNLRDLAWF
jgi:hypothetical protein